MGGVGSAPRLKLRAGLCCKPDCVLLAAVLPLVFNNRPFRLLSYLAGRFDFGLKSKSFAISMPSATALLDRKTMMAHSRDGSGVIQAPLVERLHVPQT
jgi:hypothetical protein